MRDKKEIIDYLKNNYHLKTKKEITSDLDLKWNYIQKLACLSGIKRGFNETKHDYRYSKLVDYNSLVTCYWLGFILADGHLCKSQQRIQINLSIKDKNHILKLEEYLDGFKKYENTKQIRVHIADKKTCEILSNDFKLLSNKTKNPPVIPNFLTENQLFSLIIGFIDGDGHISKKGHIIVKCDRNWKDILETFYESLVGERKSFNLTSDGCSIISISKLETLRDIYIKANECNLPIMERKWDRLKSHVGSELRVYNKYKIVENYLKLGMIPSEIKKLTNFSSSFIYKIKKLSL